MFGKPMGSFISLEERYAHFANMEVTKKAGA